MQDRPGWVASRLVSLETSWKSLGVTGKTFLNTFVMRACAEGCGKKLLAASPGKLAQGILKENRLLLA